MPTVLTEPQKNAIVRIRFDLDGTPCRGTGFVVSEDGLILTAFHVIEGRVKGQMHGGAITLRFGNQERTVTAANLKAHSVQDDWALLHCADLPADVEPLRLEKRRLADEPEWVTFGFPDENPDDGGYSSGVIQGTSSSIVLHGTDVREARIAGLSGSPCVVNGSVVGLITETGPVRKGPAGEVLARTGALYVVPIEKVADASSLLALHQNPPFHAEVCRRLKPVPPDYLDRSIKALNLMGVEHLAAAPKRERVAEAMLRGVQAASVGVKQICDALEPGEGLEILDFAATMWIEQQVIQMLEQRSLQQPLQPIAFNASRYETGLWSIHRAGYKTAQHPGWLTTWIKVVCPPGEAPMGQVLIEQLRNELTTKHFPRKLDERLRAQRKDGCPAFALIQGEPPPPAEALLEVQQAFPDLVLLVLVSHAAQSGFYEKYRRAGIVVVEPLTDAEREQQEYEAFQDASEDLTRKFNALKKYVTR